MRTIKVLFWDFETLESRVLKQPFHFIFLVCGSEKPLLLCLMDRFSNKSPRWFLRKNQFRIQSLELQLLPVAGWCWQAGWPVLSSAFRANVQTDLKKKNIEGSVRWLLSQLVTVNSGIIIPLNSIYKACQEYQSHNFPSSHGKGSLNQDTSSSIVIDSFDTCC